MATKIKIVSVKKLRDRIFTGWTFVMVFGTLLAIIALIDGGAFARTPVVPPADGSTGCQVQVAAADASGELNVRTAPTTGSPIAGTVRDGTVLDATTTVTSGYRQLKGGMWAIDNQLTRVPGTNCG